MEDELKSYDDFITEVTKEVVYPTNFKGMVAVALSGVYTQIMAIAQELANEKAARNQTRYDGTVEDIDITRAMNMVFHSNWKAKLKEKALDQMMRSSVERAGATDDVIQQKNMRAMRQPDGDRDAGGTIDTSGTRFSDKREGTGPGSNQ